MKSLNPTFVAYLENVPLDLLKSCFSRCRLVSKANSTLLTNTETLPQGTVVPLLYSTEFIDSSVTLWRKYDAEIVLSQDVVKEMAENLSGFFELLKSWDKKEINGTKKD